MKKFIYLILATICLALNFTSCSNDSSSSEDTYRTEMGVVSNSTYETNKNKISDCQDGYDSGYGEKEWCEKCKANYPKGTHVCNKK